MRIYHPKHGILHVSDQAEIERLLETGGEDFGVHDKPWIKKDPVAEVEEIKPKETQEEELRLVINVPKRDKPFKA